MAVESSGKSQGNPRQYELIENAPKTGKSTVYAWPQLVDYLKVAAQPVQGPWPPHQQPRPDPTEDSMPVAVPDPASFPRPAPATAPAAATEAPAVTEVPAVTEASAQRSAEAPTQDEAPIEAIRAAMPVDSTAEADVPAAPAAPAESEAPAAEASATAPAETPAAPAAQAPRAPHRPSRLS